MFVFKRDYNLVFAFRQRYSKVQAIIYTFSFYVFLFLYDDKLSVSDIVFEEEVLGTERKQEE